MQNTTSLKLNASELYTIVIQSREKHNALHRSPAPPCSSMQCPQMLLGKGDHVSFMIGLTLTVLVTTIDALRHFETG